MDLNKILLYRITHINNLDYIFDIGKLTCPNHPQKDPNYVNIGDISLIQKRGNNKIALPPGGTFLDYVSFYFGPRSPMLYKIWKGNQEVIQRSQHKIIYIVTSYKKIKESSNPFVYFDGHGYHHLSECYNDDTGLKEIDMQAVYAKYWSDTDDESDELKRKKQAELLVFSELPIQCLTGIGCYSEEVKLEILKKIKEKNLKFACSVKEDWYY